MSAKKKPLRTFRYQEILVDYPTSSLKLYRITTLVNGKVLKNAPENGVYWADNKHLRGIGPFKGANNDESSYKAHKHYKSTMVAQRAIINMDTDGVTPKSAQILKVDFVGRKLLKD